MAGYGYPNPSKNKFSRKVLLKNYLKSAVSNVKSFVVNKAMSTFSNPAALISSFGSTANQVTSGDTSAINTLLKQSPFERTLKTRGATTRYGDDPLGFQHLQYPSDLTGIELGNWILFFSISTNVGKNPAYNKDLELAESMGLNPGKRWVAEDSPTDTSSTTTGEAKGGGKYVDELREEYKKRGITIPRVAKTNTVYRDDATTDVVSGAIALYMPNDIKVSYGADWGSEDTGISGDVAAAYKDIRNIKSSGKGPWDIVQMMAGHAGGITAIKAGQALSTLTGGIGIGDWLKVVGKGFGMAMNNRKEMFYEGPGWREFNYNFKFWPRNPDETRRVQDIIKMFKYHMHPWKDDDWGGRIFRYPSEFEIHYLHRNGVNDKLNKISRCALVKCDVDYAPGTGNFKTFDADNSPVTYSVALHFKELEYMTKQTIQKGF